MRKLIFAIGTVGVGLALWVICVALAMGAWEQAALGAVWLFLVSANLAEWIKNEKRREGFRAAELERMRHDGIVWVEQVLLAKAVVASQFSDRVKSHGLGNDPRSVAAVGALFEDIAKVDLPEGSREEIVKLREKAKETAQLCRAGSIPADRVLH